MPPPHRSPFANVVRPLAKAKFGTLLRLAIEIKMNPSQLSDYLGGGTTMPDATLERMCTALDADIDQRHQLRLARDLTATSDVLRDYVANLEHELEVIDLCDRRLDKIRTVADSLLIEREKKGRRTPPLLANREESSATRPAVKPPREEDDEESGFTKV